LQKIGDGRFGGGRHLFSHAVSISAQIKCAGKIHTSSVSGKRLFARQITAPVPVFFSGIFCIQRKEPIMDFVGSLEVFISIGNMPVNTITGLRFAKRAT